MAKLFIGMPVYNGERFIGQALETLIHQTYTDWILLISDNNSQDGTADICRTYCKKDSRICYIKQDTKLEVIYNFKFLLQSANAPFFMWAAADDEWEPQFLEACVHGLENNPDAGLAFCNIVNIDSFGQIIREYPSFNMFVHEDPFACVASYLLAPEYLGKANLFYSVFRLALLKDYLLQFISSNFSNPFSDMSIILGIFCRSRFVLDDRVLFKKRVERQTDQLGKPDLIPTGLPYLNAWPKNEMDLYFNDMRVFSADTPYVELVENILNYRTNLNQELLDFQTTNNVQPDSVVSTNILPIDKKNNILHKIKYTISAFMRTLRHIRRNL